MEISIDACVRSLRQYQKDMLEDRPCRMADYPITDIERRQRLSTYMDLCPVCLVDEDRMNRPRDPVSGRQNLVQYRFWFYWVCPEHWSVFSDNPSPYVDATPPDDSEPRLLPEIVTEADVAANPSLLFRNVPKFCAVCVLADSLWSPTFKTGSRSIMALYSKRTFAFCSQACRLEFMERPCLYSRYTMRVKGPGDRAPDQCGVTKLDVHNLPVLGYLEQTIGLPIDAALRDLTAMRPVYPGLSVSVSAMLFFGLHVGMNSDDEDLNEYYQNLYEHFVRTCRRYKLATFEVKSLT